MIPHASQVRFRFGKLESALRFADKPDPLSSRLLAGDPTAVLRDFLFSTAISFAFFLGLAYINSMTFLIY
jgi:hypothetical protein